MSRDPAMRVGWCPGALRPMASLDGLVLRVKPRGMRLTAGQGRGVAEVARRYGNGMLELTGRGNLQVRGLADRDLPAVHRLLAGLGLLDASPEAEAVRNVVSSPLAQDLDGAAAGLEARLAETSALHDLPAKFSWLVDDGSSPGLRDVAADVRFEAFTGSSGRGFAMRLGGAEDVAAGLCAPERVADAAEAVAHVVVAARRADEGIRRMPDLVHRHGAATVLGWAGLPLVEAPRPSAGGSADVLGWQGWADVFGVAAPFGRLTVAQFEVALAAAVGGLRLTPWRTVLLPGVGPEVASGLGASGWIVHSGDARLAVAACVGEAGCRRASTAVLDDAARLARYVSPQTGIALHVSGCGKGCAHPGQAPVTLVGQGGRYDLVVDGSAADHPILRGLDVAEAARCLKAARTPEPVA